MDPTVEADGALSMPTELALRIFGALGEGDLARAARVARSWRDAAYDPSLPQNRSVAAIVLPEWCEAALKKYPHATTLEALCAELRRPRHAQLEELDLTLCLTNSARDLVRGRSGRLATLRAALEAAGPQLRRLRLRMYPAETETLTEASVAELPAGAEEAALIAGLCPDLEALSLCAPHAYVLAGAPSLPRLAELHCDFVAKPQPLARLLAAYPRLRALGSARIYSGCELPWERRPGLRVRRLEIGELQAGYDERILSSLGAAGVEEIQVMAASVTAEDLAARWLPRVGRCIRGLDLDSITFGGCSEAVRRECPGLESLHLSFAKQDLAAMEYLGHAQAVLQEAAATGPLRSLALTDLPYMRLGSLLGALAGRAGAGLPPLRALRAHRSSLYEDQVKDLPGYGVHRPFRWILSADA